MKGDDCRMTPEAIKDTVRRQFEIITTAAADRASEVVTENYINHESHRQPPDCRVPGPAGFAAAIRWLNAIFSDLEFDEKLLLCDGDHAVFYCVMRGRQTGPFGGIAGVGQRVSIRQTNLFRLSGGRIAEHWMTQEDLTLLSQLGIDMSAIEQQLSG